MNKGDHKGQLVGFQNGMQPDILSWSNKVATYFDGINERVDVDKLATDMTTSTVGAFSCWVRPVDGTPLSSKYILHFTNDQPGTSDYISVYNQSSGGLRFECMVGGSVQWRLQTNGFGFGGGWVHLLLIQDGVEPVFYTGGKKTPQTFTVSVDKTAWFNDVGQPVSLGRIGCACSVAGNNFGHYNGDIDDVSVFNTIKTLTDIWNKETKKPTRLTGQEGMRGWLRMGDRDMHPIIRDHSPIGNHGNMVNMNQGNFTRDVV